MATWSWGWEDNLQLLLCSPDPKSVLQNCPCVTQTHLQAELRSSRDAQSQDQPCCLPGLRAPQVLLCPASRWQRNGDNALVLLCRM